MNKNGRSTCLLFDVGHSSTYAVPVHDGYALQKSLMRTDIAGDYITNLLKHKIFHQLWLSKQEFEEHGAMINERKCV